MVRKFGATTGIFLVGFIGLGSSAIFSSAESMKESDSVNIQTRGYRSTILASAPIAYYRLNQSRGNRAWDSSPNGNHAYYADRRIGPRNPPTFLVRHDGRWSDNDPAIGFSRIIAGTGGSQRVTLSDRPILDFEVLDFTLEAWIKSTRNTGWHQAIISKMEGGAGGSSGYQMFLLDNGRFQFSTQSNGVGCHVYSAASNYLADNQWHHLVFVRRGATLRMYIDGAADRTTNCGAAQNVSGVSDLFIGSQPTGPSPSSVWQETTSFNPGFFGAIDEVAIYNWSLSETRIAAHFYAGTRGLFSQE